MLAGKLLESWKKLNFRLRNLYFTITGRSLLPRYIIIDICNICNLRCPLCVTGLGELKHKQCIMSFDKFREITNKLKGDMLVLSNWGEPFLNKDIYRIIKHAKSMGFYVKLDTNFSLRLDPAFPEMLIETGLDEISISLDGCSPETYSKYHVGGDFELVLGNMKRLAEYKASCISAKPKIVWKFVVNSFNEHELEQARLMAMSLGVDFNSEIIGIGESMADYTFPESKETREEKWLPKSAEFRHSTDNKKPGQCPFLFDVVVISPDGQVFPCCYTMDESSAFGDLNTETLKEIWNNKFYRSSRNLFSKRRKSLVKTVCKQCIKKKTILLFF